MTLSFPPSVHLDLIQLLRVSSMSVLHGLFQKVQPGTQERMFSSVAIRNDQEVKVGKTF